MQMATKWLGLGVLGLLVGGVVAGEPCLKPANVNVIQNQGNGRSTTLIVEPGADGRLTRSTFISDEPMPQPLPLDPVPMPVPAQPEPLPIQPMPIQPMPIQPMPIEPQPQPSLPPVQLVPEIVIRIPAIQMPNVRMPVLPLIQVPAGRTMIFDNPGGGRTVINSGNGSNVTVIGNPAGTQVFGGGGLCYKGRDNRFWSRSMYSQQLGTTVYYDPRTTLWFRYCDRTDVYRLAPEIDFDE